MGTKLEMLTDLYEYMRWADGQILGAAATVPGEGFYREQGISAGSIHKLLVHAAEAPRHWLARWEGEPEVVFSPPERFPTLGSIREHWGRVHEAVFAFLGRQTEESLGRVVHYTRRGHRYHGVLWQLMTHVADHGTYHRGQLNSMIKLAGGRPCDPSFITYRRTVEGQPV